jgi:hypothetical protein
MVKLQEAANNIAAFFTGVYDNFVSWYNAWGQKWHDFWDSLLSLLEEGINGLLEGLFELLEDVGLIDDADDYKVDFTSGTDEFVPMKSSEELAAEAELAKSEEELIAAN